MPHADSALLPADLVSTDKPAFYAHVQTQLAALLATSRAWPTNLSNASSLLYNTLHDFAAFGDGERTVNWVGA